MKTSTFVMALVATMGFTDAAGPRDLRVAGALVTAKLDDALVWNARWVLAHEELDVERVSGDIRFAAPLPEGETMLPAPFVTPIEKGGHIVGVHVDGSSAESRMVTASSVQPNIPAHSVHGGPFAEGTSLQIFDAGKRADAVLAERVEGL